jgi:hypothetical protein
VCSEAAPGHQKSPVRVLGDFDGASGEEMSEGYDQILDAATTLRVCGHTVDPDDASKRWLIDGGLWLTDAELLATAVRVGLMEGPRRPR